MTESTDPPGGERSLQVRGSAPAGPRRTGLSGVLEVTADIVRPRLGPVGRLSAVALTLQARTLQTTEQAVLGLLGVADEPQAPTVGEMPPPKRLPRADGDDPRDLMADLLTRGLQQDTAVGRRDYYLAVLRQLVPDEARIIAALADGMAAPLIHVSARGGKQPVLENASLIGRLAALTLPSRTPTYVTHLLALGLVETGPEDRDNGHGYELLLADRDVRAALKEGQLGKVPARVQRLTLRLSAHGRDLWEHTRPDGGDRA